MSCFACYRTSATLKDRLESLETLLNSRKQVEGTVESTKAWLAEMQTHIKSADQPLAYAPEQAQLSMEEFEVRFVRCSGGKCVGLFCPSPYTAWVRGVIPNTGIPSL